MPAVFYVACGDMKIISRFQRSTLRTMKYRVLILLAYLLWLPGAPVAGQPACNLSLRGQVIETHNYAPIPHAVIYIDELNRTFQSAASGWFQVDSLCAGRYTLHLHAVGYEPLSREVDISESTEQKFRMAHAAHQLAEMVVSGERVSSLLQSKEKVDAAQIAANSGRSLAELLESVNGVSVLGNGATITKPVIHGLHSNRVVLLNNGIRQEDQQWGGEHAPNIDPYIAQSVTVIKGAAGVRYGPDAIGGVVLVEPAPLRRLPGWGGNISLAGFSNNRMGAASGALEHTFRKLPALSFRVQGTLRRGGNYRIPGYWVANSGVAERNYALTLAWRKAHYGAEVFYSRFDTDLGIYRGAHTGSEEDRVRAVNSPVPLVPADFSYTIDRPRQHVSHDLVKVRLHADNRWGVWNLTYAFQHNFRQEYDVLRRATDRAQLNLTLNTQTVNLNFDHKPAGAFSGQAGVDALVQDNFFKDGDRLFIPSYRASGGAAYLLERWKKGAWMLEGGARYDQRYYHVANPEGRNQQIVYYDFRFANASGTLGLQHRLRPEWEWGLTLSSAWRAPQASELFSAGLHHGAARIELGNKQLVPEQSFNINLDHKYAWNDRVFTELSLYRQWIRNYIYLSPGADILTIRGYFKSFSYEQTDALLTGMDASLRYQWSRSFRTDFRASLLRARDRQADDWLILMPADRLSAGARYTQSVSARLQDCFVGVNGRYVLQQHRIPGNFDSIDYPRPPAAYFLVDLDIGTRLMAGRQPLHLSLTVMNLLNTRYRDYLDVFRYFIDQPGRNIVLRLRVPFDF
jgi:iron complex outermembrane receptor protein